METGGRLIGGGRSNKMRAYFALSSSDMIVCIGSENGQAVGMCNYGDRIAYEERTVRTVARTIDGSNLSIDRIPTR